MAIEKKSKKKKEKVSATGQVSTDSVFPAKTEKDLFQLVCAQYSRNVINRCITSFSNDPNNLTEPNGEL